MSKINEVLNAMANGAVFKEIRTANFGTSSWTKPIKRGLPDKKSYTLDGQPVHHSTGKSLVESGLLVSDKTERMGLGSTHVTYSIRPIPTIAENDGK